MSGFDLYERFLALHTRRDGFVMPNAWDGVSAQLFADAGFEAIGTSSLALAATLGRVDGRHRVTQIEHLTHASMIERLTGLPVNGDLEDGYGDTPEDVAATVEAAIDVGLAGIGIEVLRPRDGRTRRGHSISPARRHRWRDHRDGLRAHEQAHRTGPGLKSPGYRCSFLITSNSLIETQTEGAAWISTT